jgi:hypothetical protein
MGASIFTYTLCSSLDGRSTHDSKPATESQPDYDDRKSHHSPILTTPSRPRRIIRQDSD